MPKFLPNILYSKKWNNRKSVSVSKLWKCGRKGHYQKKSRVGVPTLTTGKPTAVKPTDEYKKKYYELKAKMVEVAEAKTPVKGLIAEEHNLANSDNSDSEEFLPTSGFVPFS